MGPEDEAMNIKTIIASATTAAVLGTIGISVAGAASSGSSSPKPASTAAAAASTTAKVTPKGFLRKNAKEGLVLAAKTIGITPQQLVTEVKGGKSIAQVATTHGKNPQDVINALVAAADKKVDASGLTADQKSKLKGKVPAAVTKLVNSPHPAAAARRGIRAELRKAFGKDAVKLAAQTIGIPAKQLVSEVKSGKTVAQVATEHGKNPTDVVNAIVAAADKKIDASTKLTATQKSKLEAKVPGAVDKFVNNWHPEARVIPHTPGQSVRGIGTEHPVNAPAFTGGGADAARRHVGSISRAGGQAETARSRTGSSARPSH